VAAARAARQAGVTVILDPAPARGDLPDELLALADILTPNEVEAGRLTGISVGTADDAAKAAEALRRRGARTVVITLGARGLVWASATGGGTLPAFPVRAVDTVAAGDAFNGALAVALAEGRPLPQALVWGAAAGALAVTREGAQPAMPTRRALERFLAEHGHAV